MHLQVHGPSAVSPPALLFFEPQREGGVEVML
jgi:hypothetical protein